jgi:hypothetical protein
MGATMGATIPCYALSPSPTKSHIFQATVRLARKVFQPRFATVLKFHSAPAPFFSIIPYETSSVTVVMFP